MSSGLFGTFLSISVYRAHVGEFGLAVLSVPQVVGHTILFCALHYYSIYKKSETAQTTFAIFSIDIFTLWYHCTQYKDQAVGSLAGKTDTSANLFCVDYNLQYYTRLAGQSHQCTFFCPYGGGDCTCTIHTTINSTLPQNTSAFGLLYK